MRQLLSHQSGAIGLPGSDEILSWDGGGWDDTVTIAAGVAAGAPAWEPGTRHGYHGVTFGWLVGELVRRLTGMSLGSFFDVEVAQRLDVACSIGTPSSELDSVATVMEFPVKPGMQSALRQIDPESKSGRSVLAGAHGSLFADEDGRAAVRPIHEHPVGPAGRDRRVGCDCDGAGSGPGVRGPRHRRGAGVTSVDRALPHRTGVRPGRGHGRAHPMGRRLLARTAGAGPRHPADARARTTPPSGTWAPGVRSGSPTPSHTSAAGSYETTWRTRRSPSWAPAWSTCCTRA